MIESLAKVLEASKEALKKSSFDPDTRIQALDKNTVKKIENKSFDPDKRIEPTQKFQNSEKEKYDPDKRIETHHRNEYNQILNQSDELIESEVKYDDNGKIYKKNGDLLANTEYTIRGYNYKTDDQSRIISVQGDLHWKEHEGRLPLEVDIHTIGKGSERSDDDRGHLIADEFNGSNGIENLVPMNSELNRNGDYRKLEKEWEQALHDKQNVHVDIEPVYSDASKRPDKFIVKYTVDGEYYEKVIINRRETNV